MADSPDATESLAIREGEGPPPDPIVSRSTSAIMLVSALLLTASPGRSMTKATGSVPGKGCSANS